MTDYVVDFATLGFMVSDWIGAHMTDEGGDPFILSDVQLWNLVQRCRIESQRRTGDVAVESGYGAPVEFAGFADGGERYDCADYGCTCGFVYEYMRSEPMGVPAR